MKILSMETEWGYEGVNDWYIYHRSEDLRSEALNFIKSQAENGCARCQYGLGQLFYFHKAYGFEKDETKAAYWWNEAAQNGYTEDTTPNVHPKTLSNVHLRTLSIVHLITLQMYSFNQVAFWL